MNMQKITTNSQRLASAPPKLAPIALACAMLALSTLSYANGALAADAAADAAAAPAAAADGMPLGEVQEVKVNARKQSLSAQKKSESIDAQRRLDRAERGAGYHDADPVDRRRVAEDRRHGPDRDRDARHDLQRRQFADQRFLSG